VALYDEFSIEDQGIIIDNVESDPAIGLEQQQNSTRDIDNFAGTQPILEERKATELGEETPHFGFKNQPKPWLPQALRNKLEKMVKGTITRAQLATAIEEVARITAEFYKVKNGRFIAAKFDGRIVESAETEIDLLLKIQGKAFAGTIFVWQVGSDSFTGWRF